MIIVNDGPAIITDNASLSLVDKDSGRSFAELLELALMRRAVCIALLHVESTNRILSGGEWQQCHVDTRHDGSFRLTLLADKVADHIIAKVGQQVQFTRLAMPRMSEQLQSAAYYETNHVWVRYILSEILLPDKVGLMVPTLVDRWDVLYRRYPQ